MKKVNRRLFGLAWFIFVLIFVSSMITVAFFLTGYIFKIINWRPPMLAVQIINTLLGLLFTSLLF